MAYAGASHVSIEWAGDWLVKPEDDINTTLA